MMTSRKSEASRSSFKARFSLGPFGFLHSSMLREIFRLNFKFIARLTQRYRSFRCIPSYGAGVEEDKPGGDYRMDRIKYIKETEVEFRVVQVGNCSKYIWVALIVPIKVTLPGTVMLY